MKLTPKLIDNAPSVINPENQLTLHLRNQQIPFIENLEHLGDEYVVLDLTNNDITEFGGIPERTKVQVLLLGRNNIKTVTQVPISLQSLSLVHNNISSFKELSNMRCLSELSTLVMLGNPISAEHLYRPFTIWLFPKLVALDCSKVKHSERAAAEEMFGKDYDTRSPAAEALLGAADKSRVDNTIEEAEAVNAEVKADDHGEEDGATTKALKMLTEEDKAKLIKELEQAQSMKDIERISRILKDGYTDL